jgi:hypothetical protein
MSLRPAARSIAVLLLISCMPLGIPIALTVTLLRRFTRKGVVTMRRQRR